MALSDTHRHMMRLIVRDADADGWAKVSALVWPFVIDLPDELVARRPMTSGGGHIKLTDDGNLVMKYCL